jgi:D-glycero-alpha-D-manno-heptose-7-phosphate kinase
MILARAPLRLSLGGGGTDLPAYAGRFGGFLVAAAIDQYVSVGVRPRAGPGIGIVHARTPDGKQECRTLDDVDHPMFREALRMCGVDGAIDLDSECSVPSGSGLGSSGALAVALVHALRAWRGETSDARRLAEESSRLELEILGEPAGRQDHYMAAFGGARALTFDTDGTVHVEPIAAPPGALRRLSENLIAFFTGARRSRVVLGEQGERLRALEPQVVDGMHRIKALGFEVRRLIEDGDVDRYGELLHEHWLRKRDLASRMTDEAIDEHYEAARRAGAIGGKLVGAGGGGYLLCYARPPDQARVVEVMEARGLSRLPIHFTPDGARLFRSGK